MTALHLGAGRRSSDARATGPSRPPSALRRRFRRQRPAVVALVVVLLLAGRRGVRGVLAPHDPDAQELANRCRPVRRRTGSAPTSSAATSTQPLDPRQPGLADRGRRGAAIGIVLGVPLGLVAGYFGGWVDLVIMRITDAVMSFPRAAAGHGHRRRARARPAQRHVRRRHRVRAAVLPPRRAASASRARGDLHRGGPSDRQARPADHAHALLPNILARSSCRSRSRSGFAILAEASLSFLGLGVQPPHASWGSMLGRSTRYFSRRRRPRAHPGLAILLTVLSFNVIGDGVRDSLGRDGARRTERSRSAEPLLEVDGLAVEFATAQGWARVVDDVSFTIGRGETLGPRRRVRLRQDASPSLARHGPAAAALVAGRRRAASGSSGRELAGAVRAASCSDVRGDADRR